MSCGTLKVITTVALLSLVDATSQIPDCRDHGGMFTAMPNTVKITCGTDSDMAAMFPCEHKFGSEVQPSWIINNKIYKSLKLPQDHFYDGKVLYVKNPKLKQDNTSYQCVVKNPLLQNTEAACLYRSTIGYLRIMCKALIVQCSPHYYLHKIETLKAITTNITMMDSSVTSYTITYSDAISGDECGSKFIPAASCIGGICSHVFEVASNSHQGMCNSDINVTVSASNLAQSEIINIDSHNSFVEVSFDMAIPSINCKFINQPKKNRKFYTIEYGPLTDGCKDLPHDMEGYLSNSNLMTLQLQLHKGVTSEICFVVKASSGSKTVIIEGIHKPLTKSNTNDVPDLATYYIAAVVVFVCGVLIIMSGIIIFGVHRRGVYTMSRVSMRSVYMSAARMDSEDFEQLELKEKENILQEIDTSTTFFQVHTVMADKDILMNKFAAKHYRYYDPQDGFGYYHATGEQLIQNEIQLHKKVILMDKVLYDNHEQYIIMQLEGTPKFFGSNFKYSSAIQHYSEQGWEDVYAQDRGSSRMLKPGMKFLFCARSKRITKTTHFKYYINVTEQCKLNDFAEEKMPGFQEIWIRYLYFQFIDQEYIRPDQRVIVRKKDGELVTGPGVHYLLGAIGEGSRPVDPPDLTKHKEWEEVFIQTITTDKQLRPGTKLLFCALMEKISKHVHRLVCDVPKECKMAEFGAQAEGILSFKPELGYGYYEFKEDELLELHKNFVLMHKDGTLYSGPGAKFFCTGNYSFDVISEKRIPPPSLDGTEWAHIFIQSHSDERKLLPGTKFLYLEYQTPYMKDDDDDDNFRQTWSSS